MKTISCRPDTQKYQFGTTHWSLVIGAGASNEQQRSVSLEWLCHQYWNPIYAYLRRFENLDPVEAEDRTQEFFAYLLEHHVVPRATPGLSRFRTFIKGVLRNFLMSEARREGRQKRGGGRRHISLNPDSGEHQVAAPDSAPDEILDRRWARRVVELAREELDGRLRAAGRVQDLDIFQAYTTAGAGPTYSDLASRFGISDWEVWKRLAGVREELRSLIRLKVAETVVDPSEVDIEMRELLELLT